MTHPFVRGLGDGSLDETAFRFYIRQDYLFLIDYGRLLSLGAARAPRLSWMRAFAGLSSSVLETEMGLHREFAARWGVADLESEVAAPATSAYCNFLLRTASLGDFGELCAAVLPCMWSYAEIGAALSSSAASDRYREWIDMYASSEFAELAAWARSVVDEVERLRHGGRVRGVVCARGHVLGRRLRSTRASPRRSVTFAPSKCSR